MTNAPDAALISAEKQLEFRLRDFLLDIEDRIYQGTLGSIKVFYGKGDFKGAEFTDWAKPLGPIFFSWLQILKIAFKFF